MDYWYLKQVTEKYESDAKELSTEALNKADRLEKKIKAAAKTDDLESPQKAIEKVSSRIESQKLFLDENRDNIAKEIGKTDREIQKIMDALKKPVSRSEEKLLRDEMNRLFKTRQKLSELQRTNDSAIFNLNHTKEEYSNLTKKLQSKAKEIQGIPIRKRSHMRQIAGRGKQLTQSGIRIVKGINGKFNPIEKKINKGDTADHGIETIRFANQTLKQGKSIVKSTVRTTRTVVAAPKKAFQLTRATIKIAAAVISHTVAFVFSPIFIIMAAVVLVLILCMALIAVAAGGENDNQQTTVMLGAYMTMVGVEDIESRYPEAQGYFKTACDNSKAAFASKIDNLYFKDSDLEHSDLIYIKKDDCGTITEYEKGFASDEYKATLKDAWSISLNEQDAIAIAYVYLEKMENDAKGTEMGIYNVAFTQEVFNMIVNTAVMTSEPTVFENQECNPPVCSTEIVEEPNPAYADALTAFNLSVDHYNDWGSIVYDACRAYASILATYLSASSAQQSAMESALAARYQALCNAVNDYYTLYGDRGWSIDENIYDYGESILAAEYHAAEDTLDETPSTIEVEIQTCNKHHKYWSYGLYDYPADTVMDSLGFSDNYKEWMQLCQQGIPELKTETTAPSATEP